MIRKILCLCILLLFIAVACGPRSARHIQKPQCEKGKEKVCDPVLVDPSWYVSSTGSGTACTISFPCSLATAFSGNGGTITAGDTIWLRGGTYINNPGEFTITVSGTATAPITIRAYNGPWPLGERVTIDHHGPDAGGNPATIFGGLSVNYVTIRDLEIIDSVVTTDPADPIRIRGIGIKYVNNIIHDTGGGLEPGGSSAGTIETTGNVIYYYGRASKGFLHGVYLQTPADGSLNLTSNNIMGPGWGLGVQAFCSGCPTGSLDHLTIQKNIVYESGVFYPPGPGAYNQNLFTASTPAINTLIWNQNYTYYSIAGNGGLNQLAIGTTTTLNSPTITNNYIGHAGNNALSLGGTITVNTPTWSGNTWIGSLSNYTCNQYGTGDTCVSSNPATNPAPVVLTNPYELGRAHIVIYNFQGLSSVSVTLPSGLLNVNDKFIVRDAQNYYGTPTVAQTTYTGAAISIPMTGVAGVAVPFDTPAPPNTQPTFGAFILQRILPATAEITSGGAGKSHTGWPTSIFGFYIEPACEEIVGAVVCW